MPASRFLKYTGRNWPNPVCSFYLPVSTSRDDPVKDRHLEDYFVYGSLLNASISTFWDLYGTSYIWLEQSSKIWVWLILLSIVCETTLLLILVPFEWRMSLKHNKCIGRVLFELGSKRSSAQVTDLKELKTWQGQILEKIICLFVCVLLCFIKPILGNRYVRSRFFTRHGLVGV